MIKPRSFVDKKRVAFHIVCSEHSSRWGGIRECNIINGQIMTIDKVTPIMRR